MKHCHMFWHVLVLLLLLTKGISASRRNRHIRERLMTTGLLSVGSRSSGSTEKLLLASTLDGSLHALSADTGTTRWTLHDDPVVNNQKDSSHTSLARFFPNPRDGSLYRYTLGTSDHPLKKLPFTIPQLVENSPCRSSDGIFYLGKKVDSFVVVERSSGEKQLVLDMHSIFESCKKEPVPPRQDTVFLGRTMYNVMLYEHTTGNRWNVTYYDYTRDGDIKEEDYGFVHYAAAGSGTLITMDKATEALVWSVQLDSPIVALFSLTDAGSMMTVPLTVVASQTLQRYLREILRRGSYLLTLDSHRTLQILTIYLGESGTGSTYAVPSLVDEQIATIQRRLNPQLLLEGPRNSHQDKLKNEKEGRKPAGGGTSSRRSVYPPTDWWESMAADGMKEDPIEDKKQRDTAASADEGIEVYPSESNSFRIENSLFANCKIRQGEEDVVVLGHYVVPDMLSERMFPINSESNFLGITHLEDDDDGGRGGSNKDEDAPSYDEDADEEDVKDVRKSNRTRATSITIGTDKDHNGAVDHNIQQYLDAFIHARRDADGKAPLPLAPVQNVIYMRYTWMTEGFIVCSGLFVVCGMIYCIYLLHRNTPAVIASGMASGGSRSSHGTGGSTGGGAGEEGEVTALLEHQTDGSVRVGKITFSLDQLLGRGSEGTMVYRGTFEGRVAAVKRVLPSSYRIAEREVRLLRSSDHHSNVIRYLCTEQCREFRYIALELCDATLEEYVRGGVLSVPPDPYTDKAVLQQATRGLAHLHFLDIVHRDIKPSNVLLQLPRSASGRGLDASSSEVGLRVLISDFGLCKKLEAGHGSFTKHSGITGTDGWIAPEMIKMDLEELRPTRSVDVFSLGCVYYYVVTGGQHPYGLPIDRQTNITAGRYDLSGSRDACLTDLLEAMLSRTPSRRPPTRAILKHPYFWDSNTTLNFLVDASDRLDKFPNDNAALIMEQGADEMVEAWLDKMERTVHEDLMIYRDYQNGSIRHLLRAIRNKRTHYQELSPHVQAVMGSLPVNFLHYWTSRFPRLVHHTWRALHCCSQDHSFAKYYNTRHAFHSTKEPTEGHAAPSAECDEVSQLHQGAIGSFHFSGGIGSSNSTHDRYSSDRYTSKSFHTYNQKKTHLKPRSMSNNFQSVFNKAFETTNWRTLSSSAAASPAARVGTSAAPAAAPWVLTRRRSRPTLSSANLITELRPGGALINANSDGINANDSTGVDNVNVFSMTRESLRFPSSVTATAVDVRNRCGELMEEHEEGSEDSEHFSSADEDVGVTGRTTDQFEGFGSSDRHAALLDEDGSDSFTSVHHQKSPTEQNTQNSLVIERESFNILTKDALSAIVSSHNDQNVQRSVSRNVNVARNFEAAVADESTGPVTRDIAAAVLPALPSSDGVLPSPVDDIVTRVVNAGLGEPVEGSATTCHSELTSSVPCDDEQNVRVANACAPDVSVNKSTTEAVQTSKKRKKRKRIDSIIQS